MQSGFYLATSYSAGQTQMTKRPTVLRVPASERRRLTKSKPVPDLRFHYREIAAALAIQAAHLLPNDSEELADVVNRAVSGSKTKTKNLAIVIIRSWKDAARTPTSGAPRSRAIGSSIKPESE